MFVPDGMPEAWEIEEVQRARDVRDAEDRERLQIPLGNYQQVPGRVPSLWEKKETK